MMGALLHWNRFSPYHTTLNSYLLPSWFHTAPLWLHLTLLQQEPFPRSPNWRYFRPFSHVQVSSAIEAQDGRHTNMWRSWQPRSVYYFYRTFCRVVDTPFGYRHFVFLRFPTKRLEGLWRPQALTISAAFPLSISGTSPKCESMVGHKCLSYYPVVLQVEDMPEPVPLPLTISVSYICEAVLFLRLTPV